MHIRYAAADKKRQTIPWVEYENTDSHEKRDYALASAKPETLSSLPTFEMQCADCHNRIGHNFQLAEAAVDQAISAGDIAASLPFIRKTGVELLKAAYTSQEEATQKIQAGLNAFYQKTYSDVWARQSNDVQRASQTLAAIYMPECFSRT